MKAIDRTNFNAVRQFALDTGLGYNKGHAFRSWQNGLPKLCELPGQINPVIVFGRGIRDNGSLPVN
jgi:hypothetical protein